MDCAMFSYHPSYMLKEPPAQVDHPKIFASNVPWEAKTLFQTITLHGSLVSIDPIIQKLDDPKDKIPMLKAGREHSLSETRPERRP